MWVCICVEERKSANQKERENKSQEFYCCFRVGGNTWHISGSYKLIKPVSHHFRSTSMANTIAEKYSRESSECKRERKLEHEHTLSDVKHFNLLHLFDRPVVIKSKQKKQ